jgi:LmbE family N-acetylglucosaminyl deacetylase
VVAAAHPDDETLSVGALRAELRGPGQAEMQGSLVE